MLILVDLLRGTGGGEGEGLALAMGDSEGEVAGGLVVEGTSGDNEESSMTGVGVGGAGVDKCSEARRTLSRKGRGAEFWAEDDREDESGAKGNQVS